MKINIPLLNVIGKAINFTYCSFFSLQNISTTSGDFFFFHFASGERWLHFSNANLLLPLYIPCTPTSSMHCLIKFPYNILTTMNVYPLTHKHLSLATYSPKFLLPLILPTSPKGWCLLSRFLLPCLSVIHLLFTTSDLASLPRFYWKSWNTSYLKINSFLFLIKI